MSNRDEREHEQQQQWQRWQQQRPWWRTQWAEVDWGRPEPTPQIVYPPEWTELFHLRWGHRITDDEYQDALAADDVAAALADLHEIVAEREAARRRRQGWGASGNSGSGFIG